MKRIAYYDGRGNMTPEYKKARKLAGITKFERECRVIKTRRGFIKHKAYRVPGTYEYCKYSMLKRTAHTIMQAWEQGKEWNGNARPITEAE